MSSEKKKFVVETVCTFVEAHVVEAVDEKEAEFIAQNSDYNASKWIGTQVANIYEFKKEDIERLKKLDNYFFEGHATITDDGYLVYIRPDGEVNGNMPSEKIR
jgi:hypothetical protein